MQQFGVIGLSVMGKNLALNVKNHGYSVSGFSIDKPEVDALAKYEDKNLKPTYTWEEFVNSLEKPRKILIQIMAGKPVDETLQKLLPLLDKGDILIDGGNSNFHDTNRRYKEMEKHGIHFIGMGVSGGEEGALNGPALMPGGDEKAYEEVAPILEAMAAKTPTGQPCVGYIGPAGSGHYVKMVHNGIEYGDMQLICEAYQLMRDGLGLTSAEMHDIFADWNNTELDSYLIEITRDILGYQDEQGETVVEHILDTAGQKGTGKWTGIAALDEGVPLTLIGEAVFARCLSAMKEERVTAAKAFPRSVPAFTGDKKAFIESIRKALYASKIISYAQGYTLMRTAAKTYGWNLNYGGIALMWRGGCIIRSVFLGKIKEAYDKNPELENLLLDDYFAKTIKGLIPAWREVVAYAVSAGIPMPAFTAALSYFDGYTSASLPANLLQAQRDYFGAHTYERTDAPRGQFFHTNWTGHGGNTTANTYQA